MQLPLRVGCFFSQKNFDMFVPEVVFYTLFDVLFAATLKIFCTRLDNEYYNKTEAISNFKLKIQSSNIIFHAITTDLCTISIGLL